MISKRQTAITLTELLVVISIIFILTGMFLSALSVSQKRAHETACLGNLKNISYALEMFLKEHGEYPDDSLSSNLAPYIGSSLPFYCPSSGKSYEKFYVARDEKVPANRYVISCPYHSERRRGVITFPYGLVAGKHLAKITWNDAQISVGDEVTGGKLIFEDGSTIILTGASSALVVTSFNLDSGSLYSIVRILKRHGKADIKVNVTPGSNFEVISPAAIAFAQGTGFRISVEKTQTQAHKTNLTVQAGTVELLDRSGNVFKVSAGESHDIQEQDSATPDDPEGE